MRFIEICLSGLLRNKNYHFTIFFLGVTQLKNFPIFLIKNSFFLAYTIVIIQLLGFSPSYGMLRKQLFNE